jgi:hypothetical protein
MAGPVCGPTLPLEATNRATTAAAAAAAGITLSLKQVERGTQLARERGLNNVNFKVGSDWAWGSMQGVAMLQLAGCAFVLVCCCLPMPAG